MKFKLNHPSVENGSGGKTKGNLIQQSHNHFHRCHRFETSHTLLTLLVSQVRFTATNATTIESFFQVIKVLKLACFIQ